MLIRLSLILLLASITSAHAQQSEDADISSQGLDPQTRIEEVRKGASIQPRVLAPTLAPQEIDRAILNKLMQEIIRSPAVAARRLNVSEATLEDIFTTLSNARGFINGSEMANIQAMCGAWDESQLSDDARIQEALDAYIAREQFTKDFISRYYNVVLGSINAFLSLEEQAAFAKYMDDRRGRMANAGTTTFGAVVQSLDGGSETVRFHCRD